MSTCYGQAGIELVLRPPGACCSISPCCDSSLSLPELCLDIFVFASSFSTAYWAFANFVDYVLHFGHGWCEPKYCREGHLQGFGLSLGIQNLIYAIFQSTDVLTRWEISWSIVSDEDSPTQICLLTGHVMLLWAYTWVLTISNKRSKP